MYMYYHRYTYKLACTCTLLDLSTRFGYHCFDVQYLLAHRRLHARDSLSGSGAHVDSSPCSTGCLSLLVLHQEELGTRQVVVCSLARVRCFKQPGGGKRGREGEKWERKGRREGL